jgi:hypothetical protein
MRREISGETVHRMFAGNILNINRLRTSAKAADASFPQSFLLFKRRGG